MTLRFVRVDPTLTQSTLDLSTLGYSVGGSVDLAPTGSFSFNAGGFEIGTSLSFVYNGTEYTNHQAITLTAGGGTQITIKTSDSFHADNVDTDGNYGIFIGTPDVRDTPDQAGRVAFPTDGLAHLVSSAVTTLDASQAGGNLFIDAKGNGTSLVSGNDSKLILDSIPANVLAGSGNDSIFASVNAHQAIDGGAGDDTVFIQAALSDFTLAESGFNFAKLVTSTGTLDLKNVEHLKFYGGAVDLNSVLTDNLYYAVSNPDVYAAGVSGATHYEQSGWHEGRNPNAFFSTTGYLAANADVAAAGINPLTHYDQSGWKEGRDPSANFDNELYLARNPDVKAAGLDPLAHYLTYGQAEGRQAYAAIGKATDLAKHPGFDAEYYLLSNPDVAKAALATGGDTFNFAYQHYESNGWHEGRNPNAVFDTKGYLAAYADVAAANIDPLAHYDSYGFKEGRDPSANFDTKTYEATYADVKASGIDPMLHYLQFGAVEGRSAFPDGHFG